MILFIDNYDSFVHNLARYVRLAGETDLEIHRNDALSLDEIAEMSPDAVILSPGPCGPSEAGICAPLIRRFGAHLPILGICLGHQCIGAAYGAKIVRSAPCHGRRSLIRRTRAPSRLLSGMPSASWTGGRYHSLAVDLSGTGETGLIETARTAQAPYVTMAIEHKTHPVFGVQYHPESCLSEHGAALVRRFLDIMSVPCEKRTQAI